MDRSVLCILKDAHMDGYSREVNHLQVQGVPCIRYDSQNMSFYNDGQYDYDLIVISTELPESVQEWAEKRADKVWKLSGGVDLTTDTHICFNDWRELGDWVQNRHPEHHRVLFGIIEDNIG